MVSLRRKKTSESVPTGTILPFGGLTAPEGFFLTDGSVKSRTQFSDLFRVLCSVNGNISLTSGAASITGFASTSNFAVGMPLSGIGVPAGTTISVITNDTTLIMSANATQTITTEVVVAPWGVGDGSTTFNIPDGRGVVFAGRDNMGGVAASRLTSPVVGSRVGFVGGSQSHTLSIPETPSHQHTGRGRTADTGFPVSSAEGLATDTGLGINSNPGPTGGTRVRPTTAAYDAVGGGQAHNNTQPTAICNYIIRY